MPTFLRALVVPSHPQYRLKAMYITQVSSNMVKRLIPFDSFEGTAKYEKDIYHWASSSTQESKCTVEPGTLEDVGKIVRLTFIFSEII